MNARAGGRLPTLEDVARAAGVSLATASRVLNGTSRPVAESYRDRVRAAADELGYRPNRQAQAVARGVTALVTLLVADISDPYFAQISAGVGEVADEYGLTLQIGITKRDPERELELVRTARAQRPTAIIIAASRAAFNAQVDAQTATDSVAPKPSDAVAAMLASELEGLRNSGGAGITFGTDRQGASIVAENVGGSRALAERLAELGYRAPLILTGSSSVQTVADRIAGTTAGFAAHGVAISRTAIREGELSRDSGYALAETLVRADAIGTYDVIVAGTDMMALGIMSALRDNGVRAGIDIGLAGFDDIPTVRDVTPALTTVRLPLIDMGRAALQLALGHDDVVTTGSAEVRIRETTPSKR